MGSLVLDPPSSPGARLQTSSQPLPARNTGTAGSGFPCTALCGLEPGLWGPPGLLAILHPCGGSSDWMPGGGEAVCSDLPAWALEPSGTGKGLGCSPCPALPCIIQASKVFLLKRTGSGLGPLFFRKLECPASCGEHSHPGWAVPALRDLGPEGAHCSKLELLCCSLGSVMSVPSGT